MCWETSQLLPPGYTPEIVQGLLGMWAQFSRLWQRFTAQHETRWKLFHLDSFPTVVQQGSWDKELKCVSKPYWWRCHLIFCSLGLFHISRKQAGGCGSYCDRTQGGGEFHNPALPVRSFHHYSISLAHLASPQRALASWWNEGLGQGCRVEAFWIFWTFQNLESGQLSWQCQAWLMCQVANIRDSSVAFCWGRRLPGQQCKVRAVTGS